MNLKFTSVQEVTSFFARWHEFSESDRLKILRGLKDLGHLGMLSSKQSSNDTTCPKYGFALVRPCSLSACQYYVESLEVRNCMHCGLSQAKKNRLTAAEVAGLTKLSQSEINSILVQAIHKIRRQVLREKIERSGVAHFYYVPGHCITCEVTIADDLEARLTPNLLYDDSGSWGWCSTECKASKPGWIFKLENDYHCDVLSVLALAVLSLSVVSRNLTNTREIISETAALLDVDAHYLGEVWPGVLKRITYISNL